MSGVTQAPIDQLRRRITRFLGTLKPMPLMAGAAALLVVAVAAFVIAEVTEDGESRPSGLLEVPDAYQRFSDGKHGVLDSDLDGAPDALENFVGTSDPFTWNSSATRIPDGWLIRHGFDPIDANAETVPAARPPTERLGPAYGNAWPESYTATLWNIYSFNRPADWNEAEDGPFDNGLDPNDWDSNDDGIPDGWAIHHGLDPLADELVETKLAGPDGITVRQAFHHDTDPQVIDTDGDGISDADEIRGPTNPKASGDQEPRFAPTNPREASTAGSGVCDGYLVAHGLDPSDGSVGYSDLGPSGATTLEAYQWSRDRFGDSACKSGKGLDPTKVSTIDGPIPDGWFLRFGLDPLDPTLPNQVTQQSSDHPDPSPSMPEDNEQDVREHVALTVLLEYQYGRPLGWDESRQGPWLGGTDPTKEDSDGDGLADAVEMRGYLFEISTDVGPGAIPRVIHSDSDPTSADTDGDGLGDAVELEDHSTDPSRRDTDMDGIPDNIELADELGLNPTRADSAGDYLRDGVRLAYLERTSAGYGDSPQYGYPGEPGVPRTVFDWADSLPAFQDAATITIQDVIAAVAPGGDADGDGTANIIDPDMDDDGLLNGWELEVDLYRFSQFDSGTLERSPTDPLNPDTDADRLIDGWEVRYAREIFCSAPCKSGYSLDPAKWDSDKNGISDAKEDPDGDSITWPIYERDSVGKIQRVSDCCTFEFTNEREQQFEQFELDPHAFSSQQDGLGDGWKVFWGQVYPGLPQDEVGLFYPFTSDPARFDVPPASERPRPSLDTPQAEVVIGTHAYTRFLLDPGNVLENEEIADVHDELPDRRDGAAPNAKIDIFEVVGTVDFGFKEIHAAGTNPYLDDTSGDGIQDWWAHLYRNHIKNTPTATADCPLGSRLDPLKHYAADEHFPWNPLPIRQAFRPSPSSTGGLDSLNPLCKDTDLDTVDDWFEVASVNLDPLDPSDAGLLESEGDVDGDGVKDGEEIFGVQRPYLGSGFIRTNASNPDTDGDGLLDGPTLHGEDGNGLLEDDPWTRLFLDMGIAYYRQGGRYHFLGEADDGIKGSPIVPDDSATGVPAGWLAAYGLPTKEPGDHVAKYRSRMPTWWVQATHGQWWGGVGPSDAPPTGNDLDGDGLQDQSPTGGGGFEDPLPGANFLNAWRTIQWDDYPPGLGLPTGTSPQGGALATAAINPLAQRILAQAYLNERGIGSQTYSFEPADPHNPPFPCYAKNGEHSLRLVDSAGATTNVLKKAQPSWLHGRLVDCESSQPVALAGVTIEARFSSNGLPYTFGAAFTDQDGVFHFPVNLTREHEIDLDAHALAVDAAIVLRGQVSGPVTWDANPALVPPGKGRFMEVRSYASPGTLPFTADRPAMSSGSAFINVRVEAGSILEITAPPEVRTGTPFKVDYRLTDSAGAPLADQVLFSWAGGNVASTPNSDGMGKVVLAAPHELRGDVELTAMSIPSEAMAEFVTPAAAATEVRLLNPIQTSFVNLVATIDAGQRLGIQAKIAELASGKGVGNVTVRFNLTGPAQDIMGIVEVTKDDGTIHAWLAIPPGVPAGEYSLLTSADATTQTTRLIESRQVIVRSLPKFTDITQGPIYRGHEATVGGRIVEPDGTPIPNAIITIRLHEIEENVESDAQGTFEANITSSFPMRPIVQSMAFGGDASHAPIAKTIERTMLSNTHLTIPTGVIARGADAEIPVTLRFDDGSPVVGAPVQLTWGTESPRTQITDQLGVARFTRSGDPDEPLGMFKVHAAYAGAQHSGRAPAQAQTTWTIEARAEIKLASGSYQAGTPIPDGLLIDAGSGAPLADTNVAIRSNGQPSLQRTTDEDGAFRLIDPTAATARPQTFDIIVDFNGTGIYPPTSNHTTLHIQTPTMIEARTPGHLVIGQPQIIDVSIRGQDGHRVPAGHVNVELSDGLELGHGEIKDGDVRIALHAPANATIGANTARINFHGTPHYAASSLQAEIIIKHPVLLSIEAEGAKPGELITIRVRATAGDEVIPFVQVNLQVEGVDGGLTGSTDADGVAIFTLEQAEVELILHARYAGSLQHSSAQVSNALQPLDATSPAATGYNAIAIAAAVVAAVMAAAVPIVYRLRRSDLEPVFRRARRIAGARGPIQEQILLAYRVLEEVAVGQGLLNDVRATPRTVQDAFARALPARVFPSLERLVTLFEIARYSEHIMTEMHRDQATHALQEIVTGLRIEAGVAWRQRMSVGRSQA